MPHDDDDEPPPIPPPPPPGRFEGRFSFQPKDEHVTSEMIEHAVKEVLEHYKLPRSVLMVIVKYK